MDEQNLQCIVFSEFLIEKSKQLLIFEIFEKMYKRFINYLPTFCKIFILSGLTAIFWLKELYST